MYSGIRRTGLDWCPAGLTHVDPTRRRLQGKRSRHPIAQRPLLTEARDSHHDKIRVDPVQVFRVQAPLPALRRTYRQAFDKHIRPGDHFVDGRNIARICGIDCGAALSGVQILEQPTSRTPSAQRIT